MKTVCKKLLSLMLVAILLVSAVPFQASATTDDQIGFTVKTSAGETGIRYFAPNNGASAIAGNILTGRAGMANWADTYYISHIWVAGGSEIANPSADSVITKGQVVCIELAEKVVTPPAPEAYTVNLLIKKDNDSNASVTIPVTGVTSANPTVQVKALAEAGVSGYKFEKWAYAGGAATTEATATVNNSCDIIVRMSQIPAGSTKYNYQINAIIYGNEKDPITGTVIKDSPQATIKLNPSLFNHTTVTGDSIVWTVNGTAWENNTNVTINTDNTIITLVITRNNAKTITLNANGGKLNVNGVAQDTTTKNVAVGGTYGTLPTPTRDNYNFSHWYWKDSTGEYPVYSTTTVDETAPTTLYAKWVKKDNYNVQFQRFDVDSGKWVNTSDAYNVPALSVLSKSTGTFPADNSAYNISGFTIVGWEIGDTDTAFVEGSTNISSDNMIIRPRYRRTVQLRTYNQNNPSEESVINYAYTVEIGEPIGSLPTSISAIEGYVFAGWRTGKDSGEYITSTTEYYPNMGNTFYGAWSPAQQVRLHIYTGGNTKTEYKTIYYTAPSDGIFDLTAVNMHAYISNYDKYLDDVDNIYGWYTLEQWEHFCAGVIPSYRHLNYLNVRNMANKDFYIMLIDNGTGSTYNTNNTTWDSSNPKTGDQIFMAVTVLAVSASALALMFYYNKKRKASN